MSNKFINRKNALQRSNRAHSRLSKIMFDRKDLVSSDYHFEVEILQYQKNRILTKYERKKIYNKYLRKYGVDY